MKPEIGAEDFEKLTNKIMNKHPVDDLFREKLSAFEKKPSSDAWNRISLGQSKRNTKLAGWIWYAAASVTLALIAGYSVWQQETAPTSEIAVVEKKQPIIIPQDNAKAVSEAQKNTIVVSEGGKSILRTSSEIGVAIAKPDDSKEDQAFAMVEDPATEPVENNQLAIPEIKAQDQVELTQNVANETRETALPELKNADRIIIVNVTSGDDSLDQPKLSRFTRVFRQLKNARAGERVNWDEVGFNPKSVLARVDSKRKL